MEPMLIGAERIWQGGRLAGPGQVLVKRGCVRALGAAVGTPDIRCAYLAPGFLDQHTHGGWGVSVMDADADALLLWLEQLARHGTAAVLPTLYTAPAERMRAALRALGEVMRRQRAGAGGARVLGAHLEGPCISPDYLGAMDRRHLQPATPEAFDAIAAGFEPIIRLVTLAPERPGAERLIPHLTARGIRVMAGHTGAESEQAAAAFDAGVTGVCHFFNAAHPIRHRSPGILTRALLDARVYAECIADMVHLHPDAVRLIHRVKGARRTILVSDSVSTTGLPDGEYADGDETVLVRDSQSRTPDGHLTGGTCPLAGDVRAAAQAIPAEDALRMASLTPREFLGMRGTGLTPGRAALITCLDAQLTPVLTVAGAHSYPA